MNPRRLTWSLAAALIASPVAGGAQEPAATFGEIVEVRIINVEVVATDSHDNPVPGLTREDFELQVEGESTKIANFFEVGGGILESASDVDGPIAPPAGSTRGLHLAVIVDETHITNRSRAAVFAQLKDELDGTLRPGDRVFVARIRQGLEIVQGFTSDRVAIARAIDRVVSGPAPMRNLDLEHSAYLRGLDGMMLLPCNESSIAAAHELAGRRNHLGERRYRQVIGTLSATSGFLSSIRGIPGRKAVIFVSDGLPERPLDSLVEIYRERIEPWALDQCENGTDPIRDELDSAFLTSTLQAMQTLTRQASEVGAIFYPIVHSSVESAGTRMQGAGARSVSRFSQSVEEETLMGPLLMAADETGGRLSTNSAGLANFLTDLRRDFSNYYSLGFAAPDDWGEDYKNIKASLKEKRPGVRLRHVDGFANQGVAARLEALAAAAGIHGVDTNPLGLLIQERLQTKSEKKGYQVSVVLAIPMANLTFQQTAQGHVAELDLVLVAVDADGNASQSHRDLLPIVVPSERLDEARRNAAGYPIELAMREGQQTLAIGVHDRTSGLDSVATLSFMVGREE